MHLGKRRYRVGDRVAIGVRLHRGRRRGRGVRAGGRAGDRRPAARAAPVRAAPDDPALLTATFPAEQAGAYTLRIVPATGADAGAAIRVSTTTFRVEPPRREVDEPSLNRALLADLARLTGGRVLDVPDVSKLDELIPMREVTRTLEARDELWDAPLLYATIILGLTVEWISRKMFRMV